MSSPIGIGAPGPARGTGATIDGEPPRRTVDEHLAAIVSAVPLLTTERVGLDDALGRTLRAPVHAATSLPAFDNSAMDGFALRFSDLEDLPDGEKRFRVVADLPAGSDADPPLPRGTAARIMTGAPVPRDADTVVPFEDTVGGLGDSLSEAVVVHRPTSRGAHVRHEAEDVARGDEILVSGIVLGPAQLAAAAAVGVREFLVSQRPRVAIISTGSELRPPGIPLRRGQIPESNSWMLASAVREAGCSVVHRGHIADDPSLLLETLSSVTSAARGNLADVVLFSGGLSAGAFEVVKQALAGVLTVTPVDIRPGRLQGFGVLGDGIVVFGLPGNPVSAAASFEAFARPALLQMQGRNEQERQSLYLPVSAGWRSRRGLRHYLPVTIDRSDPAGWTVASVSPGSHRAASFGRADGWAVLPEDTEEVRPGDIVRVLLTS